MTAEETTTTENGTQEDNSKKLDAITETVIKPIKEGFDSIKGEVSKGAKVMEGELKLIKRGFRKNGFILELEGEKDFLKEIEDVDKIEFNEDQVKVELKKDGDPQKFLKIVFERGNLRSFKLLEPSLEEIFIEKVREHK